MIEVEKKFILSESDRKRLLAGAESIGTKTFTDVYYDNAGYDLTIKDWWLRSRNGALELKTPAGNGNPRTGIETNQYEEFESEDAIKKQLGINSDKPLPETLPLLGYRPFGTMTTVREKYKKDGFTIDIDSVDFGFNIAEIELMVEDGGKIEEARQRIIAFTKQHGLKVDPVRGKVLEYLARIDQEHFRALEVAWRVTL